MDREEILENITCHTGIEDEVLKLFCLIQCCTGAIEHNKEEYISREYVINKIKRILIGAPIILDSVGKEMFVRLKLNQQEARK